MVMLDRNGIPKKVLLGKDPAFRKVANYYRALLIQELFRLLNESYWVRAKGQADGDLIADSKAAIWEPLKEKTIEQKRELELYSYDERPVKFSSPIEGRTPQEQKKLDRAENERMYWYQKRPQALNPKERVAYAKAFKQALDDNTIYQKELKKRPRDRNTKILSEAKTEARKSAMLQVNSEREYAELINIRTGRLVGATSPGQVINNRYYAYGDQQFEISFSAITMDISAVPYAVEVDSMRTIIPDDMSVWIEKAHNNIIKEVRALYDSLFPSVHTRRARAKANSRAQANRKRQTRRDNRKRRR